VQNVLAVSIAINMNNTHNRFRKSNTAINVSGDELNQQPLSSKIYNLISTDRELKFLCYNYQKDFMISTT